MEIVSPNREMFLSLRQPTEQQEYLPLGATGMSFNMTPEVASARAFRAKQGSYAGTDPTFTELYERILNGGEDTLRTQRAAYLDAIKSDARYEQVKKLTKTLDPTNEAQIEQLRQLAQTERTDPNSVFEEEHAREYFKNLETTRLAYPDSWIDEAYQNIPDGTQIYIRAATGVQAMQQIGVKVLEEQELRLKNQSTGGFLADFLPEFIPGIREYRMRGHVPGVNFWDGFLGSNLERQVLKLFQSPSVREFEDKLRAAVNGMNPSNAREFAEAVVGMTSSSKFLNNIFTPIDVLGVGQMGLWGARLARRAGQQAVVTTPAQRALAEEARTTVVDMVRASATVQPSPVVAAATAGDLVEAGIRKATAVTAGRLAGRASDVSETIEGLFSYFTFIRQGIADGAGAGAHTREFTNRLLGRFDGLLPRFAEIIVGTPKVDRTPVLLAIEGEWRKVASVLGDEFKTANKLNDGLLDVNVYRNPVTGNLTAEYVVGKPDASYFMRKQDAERYMQGKQLHKIGGEVYPKKVGAGYYISVRGPVDETHDIVRQGLLAIKDALPPVRSGWFGGIRTAVHDMLKEFRTPDEVLSLHQNKNRKTATYTPSVFTKFAETMGKEINTLTKGPRSQWRDWERILETEKELTDPLTKEKGYFYRSESELQYAYRRHLKRDPTEAESAAYWSRRYLIEAEAVLMEINQHRNWGRLGAQQHTIYAMENGVRTASPVINGMRRKGLPGSKDELVMVSNGKKGEEEVFALSNTGDRKKYEQLIKDGKFQVIEIVNPEHRPLKGYGALGDTRVNYILTTDIETKPLGFQNIPRRGGGHFEPELELYAKQARVIPTYLDKQRQKLFRNIYEGDTTVFGFLNSATAKEILPKINEVIKLMDGNKLQEARLLFEAHAPKDLEWREFMSWFFPKKVGDELLPPRLTTKEPIVLVPKNKNIGDMDDRLEKAYGATFKNGVNSGSPNRQGMVQFTQERDATDLYMVKDKGTVNNPLYAYERAPFIDPIISMERGLSRIIHGTFLDDYKMFAIEHWVQQAKGFLDASPTELTGSIYHHFSKPQWRNAADPVEVKRLETQRFQIQQLIGLPNEREAMLLGVANRLAESMHGNKFFRNFEALPTWLLPKLSDPFEFARQMVFQAKMGLYAWPQFFTQSMTYVNIYGIAGTKYAAPGSIAAILQQFSRVNNNEKIMAWMDKMASSLTLPGMSKWRPGEWLEANKIGELTGFFNIQGEYALRDTFLTPQLYSSGGRRFLHWGESFFREGERNARYGAWYTAFKEFRDANPFGKIGNAEIQQIMERSDILYGNMSRASSSRLHTGVLSVPMQFYAYQIRMAELMTGTRLSKAEKTRLIVTNGLVYGMPTAGGLYGAPFGDYFRKARLEGGTMGDPYVVGDNFIETFLMEGGMATAAALISGEGPLTDIKKRMRTGKFYNFSEKWGVQGLEAMREALRGDLPAMKLLGGASYSMLEDMARGSVPFWNWAMSFFRDHDKAFPLRMEDMVQAGKAVSSVNYGSRGILAINSGRWYSKKEAYLDKDVGWLNAAFMTALGVQPQDVSDLNLKAWSLEHQRDLEKDATQLATVELQKAARAFATNPTAALEHQQRAKAILRISGMQNSRIGEVIVKAATEEPLIYKMDLNFYIRNAPQPEMRGRMRAKDRRNLLEIEKGKR